MTRQPPASLARDDAHGAAPLDHAPREAGVSQRAEVPALPPGRRIGKPDYAAAWRLLYEARAQA